MEQSKRTLHIHFDEAGDESVYSKDNPIYAVPFVAVEDASDNDIPLETFALKLGRMEGGDHFVHVGNLVRNEKPYQGMDPRKRQDLFYVLFLLAKYAKYRFCCAVVEKSHRAVREYGLDSALFDAISEQIEAHRDYFASFDSVILHYDGGQQMLRGVLISAFRAKGIPAVMEKTLQSDDPFMQIADLLGELELLTYKAKAGTLTKSERAFFGEGGKIKKDYIKQLESKRL